MDPRAALNVNTAQTNVDKTREMEGPSLELASGSQTLVSRAHSARIIVTPWKTLRQAIVDARKKCEGDNNPETLAAYRQAVSDGYEHWNRKNKKLKYQVIAPSKKTPQTFLEENEAIIAALAKKTRKTKGISSSLAGVQDEEIVRAPPLASQPQRKLTSNEARELVTTVDIGINEEKPFPQPAKRGWLQFFSECCCPSKDESDEVQTDEPTYSTMVP